MPRGRIPFPFTAWIAPLDPVAIEASGDYDDDFGEVRIKGTDGVGTVQRKEGTPYSLQVGPETDRQELARFTKTGDVPDSAIGLVVDIAKLEAAGLVDSSTGKLEIKKDDRLLRIEDRRGHVVQTFDEVKIYATEVRRLNAWIGSTSNFALVLFQDRPQGVTS